MHTINKLLITTLLTSIGLIAMTAKVSNENKVIYETLEGDSTKVQGKRGLAVEVKYKSQHVDVGINADINITIVTALSEGTLNVNLRPLNTNMTNLDEKDLKFTLTKGKNSFPINLEFSSEESGIHYINLSMSVEGQGSRVIVVPVNIGRVSEKLNNKNLETTSTGTSISVSVAQEKIK